MRNVDYIAVALELAPLLLWWVLFDVEVRAGFLVLLCAGFGWWKVFGFATGIQAALTRFGALSVIFMVALFCWTMSLLFDSTRYEAVGNGAGVALFVAMVVSTIISAALLARATNGRMRRA
jgi:hypothetical protein